MSRMPAIDDLPIPDWGLECPHCGSPLVGLLTYRCDRCDRPFNIRQLLGRHRPIPDMGLTCHNCGYSLTGLTGSRCPECGVRFSLREMFEDTSAYGAVDLTASADPADAHLKRREPAFTGHERPLPDFGLLCGTCESPLKGAADDHCPVCGDHFDSGEFTGNRDWVDIGRYVPRSLSHAVREILYQSQVPYLVDNARLQIMYGGKLPFASGALRVHREFFFDAMFAIAQSVRPAEPYARRPWACPACGEEVPAGFEICWNCGGAHPSATEADLPREP